MSIYLNILGLRIPSYGLMITLGVILANVFALYPLKKYKLIFDDFLILEAYTLLGAFIEYSTKGVNMDFFTFSDKEQKVSISTMVLPLSELR